jgi:di/tricarboxylate transporter
MQAPHATYPLTFDQGFLMALLVAVLALLLWGRIRYDIVALGALLVAAAAGVLPPDQAFAGFGHPATIIVALVLIVSRGLQASGAIERLGHLLVSGSRSLQGHIGIMSGIAAALSGLMNNVATLALLMPLDMQAADRARRSPALTLMPLSFATILGGMLTLIGTPPNIVIATYRSEAIGEPFEMFDFLPVGLAVAVVGVLYVTFLGWRLVPAQRTRHAAARELKDLEQFIVEATVASGSKSIGQALRDLDPVAEEHEVEVLGLVRRGKRLPGAARSEEVTAGDVLVLQGGPDSVEKFLGAAGLTASRSREAERFGGEIMSFAEVVVPEGAHIEGRSALDVGLLYRQGVTLVGVSRGGERFRERVRQLRLRAGDLLLLLGPAERLPDVVAWLGCLPLAERGLEVTRRHMAWPAVGLFAAAIVAASLGWVYLPVALGGVVVAYALLRILPLSQIYSSIEWPVIVLIGSLIPIGSALESSGATALIADGLLAWTHGLSPVLVLALVMIVTMTLSDVLNNVATALIAAPIGLDIATRLGVNPDTFLMGIAVAASCAFLTPIGHKNNTIVMGPGGYQFGDYWRMGLPLEVLVLLAGIPVLLYVWPL